MTVTKKQAIDAGYKHTLFHAGACEEDAQPALWRSNGLCKTWARKPTEFRLPLKRGLQSFGYLTHMNASEFHLVDECPMLAEEVITHA